MNKLEKTLLGLTAAAMIAGCVGSSTPRYAGPPRTGSAHVDSASSSAAHTGVASVTSPTRTAYDQTRDSDLNLLDADKPFLFPDRQSYQPTPRQQPARPTPEQELPAPQRQYGEEYY